MTQNKKRFVLILATQVEQFPKFKLLSNFIEIAVAWVFSYEFVFAKIYFQKNFLYESTINKRNENNLISLLSYFSLNCSNRELKYKNFL